MLKTNLVSFILLDKYDKIGKIKFIEELKNFNISKGPDFLIKL